MTLLRRFTCGLVFIVVALAAGEAEAKKGTRAPPSGEREKGRGAKGEAVFALVVGVNRSVDQELDALRYADDDAARFFELFTTAGARSVLVTRLDENTARLHTQAAAEAHPPTEEGFRAAVSALAADVKRAKGRGLEAVLYFVYAGHGNVDGGRGYITLEDQRLSGADLKAQVLDKVNADQSHLVVDACYSFFLAYGRGAGGRRRPLDGFGGLGALADDEKIGLLLSTSSAAESHEWEAFQSGVFSHEVRSGLWGGADVNGDGAVSYAELAAFVEHANASVPNERYRPRVHARPPKKSTTLFRLGPGLARGIEVAGTLPGHWMLEDKLGVRLVDLHNAEGVTVTLLRPSRGVLFMKHLGQRSGGGGGATDVREYLIAPEGARTRLSELKPEPPRVSGRGAAHHAFGQLFALPFGPEVVTGFKFSVPDTVLPEPPVEVRRAALERVLDHQAPSLAVLDLRSTEGGQEAQTLASLTTAAVAEGLSEAHRGPVLSMLDLEALLQRAAYQQMAGCGDDACVVDLAKTLDVDEVVAGRVGSRGGQVLVFLSRIDPKQATVLGRTSRAFAKDADLRLEVKAASRALLDPAAAHLGDRPVAAFRTALVVEEVAGDARVPRGAVEACVQKQLLDAGAPVVSARQVRSIKGRSARELLDLDPADLVTEDEVDALLVATVDYAPAGEAEGVLSYEAVLSLELVQVDTGEVIVSDTMTARAPGHSSRQAVTALGKRLCQLVRPTLEEALARRQAGGARVVLELDGGASARGMAELASTLMQRPFVARATPRRQGRDKAVIDLVVRGTDGVGVALALDEGAWGELGLVVVEASEGKVVARAR